MNTCMLSPLLTIQMNSRFYSHVLWLFAHRYGRNGTMAIENMPTRVNLLVTNRTLLVIVRTWKLNEVLTARRQ
jgi:hypothetical protein